MPYKTKSLALGLCTILLCACAMTDESVTTDYNRAYVPYTYQPSDFDSNAYYRGAYYNYPIQRETESVDTYPSNDIQRPVSFKRSDRNWIDSQNPNHYTLEVADDEKAAQVAEKLYKIPKNDRTAQLRYKNNDKITYKGVYGSFDNANTAQRALDSLPAGIKDGASVKSWGSLKNHLEEAE